MSSIPCFYHPVCDMTNIDTDHCGIGEEYDGCKYYVPADWKTRPNENMDKLKRIVERQLSILKAENDDLKEQVNYHMKAVLKLINGWSDYCPEDDSKCPVNHVVDSDTDRAICINCWLSYAYAEDRA